MTIGEKLIELRRLHNYTQEDLAEIMGVSRQSVSKWESNIAYTDTEKLIKLSELYHCSIDYLLKDIPENNWNVDTGEPTTDQSIQDSYYHKNGEVERNPYNTSDQSYDQNSSQPYRETDRNPYNTSDKTEKPHHEDDQYRDCISLLISLFSFILTSFLLHVCKKLINFGVLPQL